MLRYILNTDIVLTYTADYTQTYVHVEKNAYITSFSFH